MVRPSSARRSGDRFQPHRGTQHYHPLVESYLLGTQPNVYLSVRKFDDASSPGQAAIGTMPLGDNAWHHVEVEFLIGTTSGTVRTWVDGVADISFTGDTSDAASGDFSVMDHVLLCGSCANSGNAGTYMDDVIIWDDEGVPSPAA